MKNFFFLTCFLLFFTGCSFGQTHKQKQLERKRAALQQEITRVNKLLFSTKKEGENLLSVLSDLNQKIKVRSNLIKVIKQEASYIKNQIQENELIVKKLHKELIVLKKDYSDMILKSYQSKSKQNKLMFLLSSKDFFQAYKRFRYMKQYAAYRKRQGDSIVLKTEKVISLKRTLEYQKSKKDDLVYKNKQEALQIKLEKQRQESLVREIKSKEKTYISLIKKKQKEERIIDKAIESIIRKAIAASNKKSSNVKSSGFKLTPKGKALATRFEHNKGALPWPVKEGVVTRKYGVIPHPTLSGIKIDSKGIHIATKQNALARAVFKGTVLAIQYVSGRYAVYIQHGNYISLYNNLDKVYVSKGQEVMLKQSLGTVFRDKLTGKTILKFQIWRDTQRQNPTYWLAKM